ncbi:hypothetical protein K8352_11345 [Flavobacteriaceae bacterium F89]|uniref:DNA primase n=1 Tax=Cerina litoralis TaxID=2874477 RepID=A0AAE3EUH4_9FLAO|nr:hypothetical protein [Cerina litoralis]MCG2461345.1 hypothetical protein [Cerina litoralis]
MKRLLVDYKKLTHEIGSLLIESYPHGYGDSDIISFKNSKDEIIEAVEVRTEDAIYLVKISKCLAKFIAEFDDTIEKELEAKPEKSTPGPLDEENDEMEFELENDFDMELEGDFD